MKLLFVMSMTSSAIDVVVLSGYKSSFGFLTLFFAGIFALNDWVDFKCNALNDDGTEE